MAGNDRTEHDRTEHDHTRHDHAPREPTAPVRTGGATVRRGTAREAVAAQRAVFGGISWGAAFFGWLSANGLAVLRIAWLPAGGVALGRARGVDTAEGAAAQAETLGIGGGIAILVVLILASLAGGYVAGRMARFDGARQGVAVWLIGLLVVWSW